MLNLDLRRNVSRVHEMSVDGRDETVVHSDEFKREL
jgi:hypothetical protein